MSKRKQQAPEVKAKLPPKGEETVAELASRFGVHHLPAGRCPRAISRKVTMINPCKRALPDGASGIFERGSRKAPVIDEDPVWDQHAKIGAGSGQVFFEKKAQTPGRQVRRGMTERVQPDLFIHCPAGDCAAFCREGWQCALLQVPRSSFHPTRHGETEQNFASATCFHL